jgi:hypothetical protein
MCADASSNKLTVIPTRPPRLTNGKIVELALAALIVALAIAIGAAVRAGHALW